MLIWSPTLSFEQIHRHSCSVMDSSDVHKAVCSRTRQGTRQKTRDRGEDELANILPRGASSRGSCLEAVASRTEDYITDG